MTFRPGIIHGKAKNIPCYEDKTMETLNDKIPRQTAQIKLKLIST